MTRSTGRWPSLPKILIGQANNFVIRGRCLKTDEVLYTSCLWSVMTQVVQSPSCRPIEDQCRLTGSIKVINSLKREQPWACHVTNFKNRQVAPHHLRRPSSAGHSQSRYVSTQCWVLPVEHFRHDLESIVFVSITVEPAVNIASISLILSNSSRIATHLLTCLFFNLRWLAISRSVFFLARNMPYVNRQVVAIFVVRRFAFKFMRGRT